MSKRAKVTFSVILVICLLLSGMPGAAPVAAVEVDEALTSPITESTVTEPQAVAEQTAAVTEEIPVLQLDADCQILSHVDPEVFAAGNHIARLPEQETLSSYVFLNADGSQTVYYMDQPVKFEKADGTVVDKNLTLTAATEGYTTTQNDIQLTIPTNPTNGIRLVYDNHQITLIPQGGTLTKAAQATDNSVTYPNYYGEGMSLRYTPTLSGVKEDILLDAYSGVNSFTFRLNTGGLNLYQANGRYYLADSKAATDRIELGEVVTYDAKSKFSIGTMTAQTIMPGQAYMLTLTVDEAFLTNENTTYPVTIDPTLTISYGNNGSNYIIDAPIFEGYPNNNYGAFQYNRVGYVDSSYQSGRTVVKLPVLTSSSIYTSLTGDFQKWILTLHDDGYYSIISVQSGLALSVASGHATTADVSLIQQTYSGSDRQKWSITRTSNNQYIIKAKSSETASSNLVMSMGASDVNVVDGVKIQQRVFTDDVTYIDEWQICSIINIGFSTDDCDGECPHGHRPCNYYANAFYDGLGDLAGGVPLTKIHKHNIGSTHTASVADFAENGAISNDIDFMVYIGHGHSASSHATNAELGNHLHYDCGILGTLHVYDENSKQYLYCNPEGNVYTKGMHFGSSTSDLRWVWLYTCHFLSSNEYVSDNDLKEMMTGAHIVMGYATQSYLCEPNVALFSQYLAEGRPIIESYFSAGKERESLYAHDNHLQKVLYISQAENETIYSPMIHYEYEPSDVRIATSYIMYPDE